MELIPEWAPNLHPMVVHFPIAILSIAVLMDFIGLLLPKNQQWWNEKSTAVLYAIGALTAIGVYFTGTSAADSVFLPAEAQNVLNTHADWALWTVWFFGIYAAARVLFLWKVDIQRRSILHISFFGLSLIGMFFLFQTGDHGAEMVFKHGVGIQVEEPANTTQAETETDENRESFTIKENGNWSWEISDGSSRALREQFHFLEGSYEHLNPETLENEEGTQLLQFSGDNLDSFFVTHNTYQNIQMDYYLNLSDFEGTVTLVNHVRDENNYDYVSVSSSGTVEQGRVDNGQTEVFEQGQTDISQPLFLRVVVNDTHFRGYIDEEMVVHGHDTAPEPGNAGMKLNGSGTLLLERMELVQL